jgi:VanZ family protein
VIRSLRFWPIWLGLGAGVLLVGLVVAVMPLTLPAGSRYGDKLLHLSVFALLTVWFFGIFRRAASLWVALVLCGYGVLIEVLQSFTDHRFAEPLDLMFNVIGIGAGWLVAAAGLHGWCEALESWFGVDRTA